MSGMVTEAEAREREREAYRIGATVLRDEVMAAGDWVNSSDFQAAMDRIVDHYPKATRSVPREIRCSSFVAKVDQTDGAILWCREPNCWWRGVPFNATADDLEKLADLVRNPTEEVEA